ncbi:PilZ domain-containing protein [Alkalimarinus alittae]|uniref:PilZ domain-containing protein n=1 Tax=Alkalimarinus alittae TaxID=2961619 RepID=A0ABY6N6X3_9ALTE|nr:PilZ domain-containing protein [Alkalimarinus alittae]UZE97871.1 PilZ domain-containing protein [Alkalimarinus alittae]
MDNFDIKNLIKDDERREESRLSRSATLFVETVSAAPGSLDGAEVVSCKTLDFSANGLQVKMDTPLTAGAIHQMTLEFPNSDEKFELTGEVRWVRLSSSGSGYVAGIMLFNSEGTEIIDWKLAIANWLSD